MPTVELDTPTAEGSGATFTPPPAPEPEPLLLAPASSPSAQAASAPKSDEPRQSATGVEQWRGLVAAIFPAFAVDTVLRIMECESHGNAGATGTSGERGLMQIHPLHRDSTYDPEGNLRAAFRISGGGTSWGAWTCKP